MSPATYDDINYDMLPDHMREHAREYVEQGASVGDFLFAVLSNDLVGAFGRADATNKAAMAQWARWLYNEAPSRCWGSPEKVRAWLEEKP